MTDILFLTLRTFSATGGIEKMCRIIGKGLFEFGKEHNKSLSIRSMYDENTQGYENRYFPSEIFRGYGMRRIDFVRRSVAAGRASSVVMLSHFNLLTVGAIIKKINPSVRLIMMAHGIEVWNPIAAHKRRMLALCDEVWCVSNYTREKIIECQGLNPEKCKVLNNCLDPFLGGDGDQNQIEGIRQRYGFGAGDNVIFTLARLSSREKYKGYDVVIRAIALLKDQFPKLHYMIGGGYDEAEKAAVDLLIENLGLKGRVMITGFIKEDELAFHFQAADIYVMPSREEGFGIVFIEAMKYGLPVIGGNMDGTADALQNGVLGILADPTDDKAIAEAICRVVEKPEEYLPDQNRLKVLFGYEAYKRKLNHYLLH